MNVQFTSQLHRFHLILILTLTLTTAIIDSSAYGERFDASNDILPIRSNQTNSATQGAEQQLCGWASLGTHDSSPLPTLAPPPLISKANSQRACKVSQSSQVSINIFFEPYAVVGPSLNDSLKAVQILQDWGQPAAHHHADPNEVLRDPLEIQLQELATQEPVDVESLGPSVLLPTNRKRPGIEIARIDPLIGSSPVIATIEEDYMPYDLSARDLRLWSAFPIASHPFCVRGQTEDHLASQLWDDFDTAMARAKATNPDVLGSLADDSINTNDSASESPASPSDLTGDPSGVTPGNPLDPALDETTTEQEASAALTAQDLLATLEIPATVTPQPVTPQPVTPADRKIDSDSFTRSEPTQQLDQSLNRLLETLKWDADDLAVTDSLRDNSSLSVSLGRLLGTYTQAATRWLSNRAIRTTSRWPVAEQDREQSRAGAKLLARAGVLESGIIEDNAIAGYEPIERLDGVDCGSHPNLHVATAKDDATSR